MRLYRFFFLLLLSFTTAHAEESRLNFHYEVVCDDLNREAFPAITGEVTLGARKLRFQLFRYEKELSLSLGTNDAPPRSFAAEDFYFFSNPSCYLKTFQAEATQAIADKDPIQKLAKAHSPFLIIRPDQYQHPSRDVPLGITYSLLKQRNGFSIRYTYYFSNESTHGPFTTSKPTSLGAYGRRTDIEWIYEVFFNENSEVISRSYQGGVVGGAGHARHSFRGRFLKKTEHPILYNIAKHNVFSDRPLPGTQKKQKVGYHLIPNEEIKTPDAREVFMWNHPWMFEVSDRELRRNGELTHPSHEYLYVRMQGNLANQQLQIKARLREQKDWTVAGEGKGTLHKLGEDLFQKETYSAIYLGEEFTSRHGEIRLLRNSRKIKLSEPRFYQLIPDEREGMIAREISAHFTCKNSYRCEF